VAGFPPSAEQQTIADFLDRETLMLDRLVAKKRTLIERLKEKRYAPSTPQKLRDSHHMIARLRASGLRGYQIAERMGYSSVRVNDLLNSPAMEELVAQYRAKVDEAMAAVQTACDTLQALIEERLAARKPLSFLCGRQGLA
jgi:hypothetical protein